MRCEGSGKSVHFTVNEEVECEVFKIEHIFNRFIHVTSSVFQNSPNYLLLLCEEYAYAKLHIGT